MTDRFLFHIPQDVAYLNCAYMAPALKTVGEAGERGLHAYRAPWTRTGEDFFEPAEVLRELFAKLVGGSKENVALVPSTSYGIQIAANNLPIKSGGKIVVLAEQYPSNIYPWRELVKSGSGSIVTVARPPDGGWTKGILDAIDSKTSIVSLPQCHWTDGSWIDLHEVSKKCQKVGAALVLDLTQSLGAAPFKVSEIEPDFLVAASYKWLFGPYGLTYLYVHDRWLDGRPIEFNWVNRLGSENFANLVQYQDLYQPGARRFDVGQKTNLVLMYSAAAALEQVLKWGVDHIALSLRKVTNDIAARAHALGLSVYVSENRCGHMIGLRFSNDLPPGLIAALTKEKIFVSQRGNALRVAPHLYNSAEDIDRLFAVLKLFCK
jgi:selenocysteine lyase/cysteine desulfurase